MKLPFFKSLLKTKEMLGLDIGTNAIKAVLLKMGTDGVELVNAGLVELNLEPGITAEQRRIRILEGLKRLVAENDIKSKDVISVVPGQSVIVRHLRLPAGAKQRIDQVIKFEAQNQIPFPADKVGMDYQVQGKTEGEDIKVILAAMKKELIDNHLSLVEEADLRCEIIDISSLALYNALIFKNPPKEAEAAAFIDIGATTTDISIHRDGVLEFTRSVPVAGNDLTEAIQNKLKVSFNEAEKIKREKGDALLSKPSQPPAPAVPSQGVPEVAAPAVLAPEVPSTPPTASDPAAQLTEGLSHMLENIFAEIRRSLNYYRTQAGGTDITKVVLSGGSARLKNLDSFLSKRLGVPVEIADPLLKIKYDSLTFKLKDLSPSFSVAVGLALRALEVGEIKLNLLPDLVKEKALHQTRKRDVKNAVILGVVVIILAGLVFLQKLYQKEARLHYVETELHKVADIVPKVQRLEREKALVEKKMKVVEALLLERARWLEVLLEMTRAIPSSAWVQNASFPAKNSARITAQAADVPAVSSVMDNLSRSSLFSNVKLGDVVHVLDGGEKFPMNWEIHQGIVEEKEVPLPGEGEQPVGIINWLEGEKEKIEEGKE
jgi:type IV pilus assembly protein PilM